MDCGVAVYEHAAFLLGRSPWDVSRHAELLFQAHAEAYRRYRHGPIVVSIDIYNLEAEAYGAKVQQPRGNGIPAVVEPLCRSIEEMGQLEPFDPARAGRIPMTLDTAARLARAFPEADVRVPMAGPMSIASNLMGFEGVLCELAARPEATAAALSHLVEGQLAFCKAIRDAGLDVAFFESAAAPPLLSPKMFHRVELPALTSIVAQSGRILGHPIPCVMGGDTEPILDDILATGTGYVICPDETDQAAFMRRIWDRTDVRVRVNTSPRVLCLGTREDIRADVDRIAQLVAGRDNVCLGTGALPYETPPENVLWLQQLCRQAE